MEDGTVSVLTGVNSQSISSRISTIGLYDFAYIHKFAYTRYSRYMQMGSMSNAPSRLLSTEWRSWFNRKAMNQSTVRSHASVNRIAINPSNIMTRRRRMSKNDDENRLISLH